MAPGIDSMYDNFSVDREGGRFQGDSGALHLFALYFYDYCISSTSDHQAFDPGGWGPLT